MEESPSDSLTHTPSTESEVVDDDVSTLVVGGDGGGSAGKGQGWWGTRISLGISSLERHSEDAALPFSIQEHHGDRLIESIQ